MLTGMGAVFGCFDQVEDKLRPTPKWISTSSIIGLEHPLVLWNGQKLNLGPGVRRKCPR